MEKKVGIIAWIPLQIVAFIMVCLINGGLLKLFRHYDPDFFFYWGNGLSGLEFSIAALLMLGVGAFVVMIVGGIILLRHEYGSKKFWIHCGVWYAVYLVLAIGVIVYEASDCGIRGDYPVTALGIAIGLYPIIVLLVLMAVVTIARVISRLVKNNQKRS